MPERTGGHRGRSVRAPQDQAAGLRRLFSPSEPHWLPILLGPDRDRDNSAWLATVARACVEQGARTLMVDAARAQVAAAFGLRVRYDLSHAFNGDCSPLESCVAAGPNLRILPAARALEESGRAPERLRRFAAGVRALATPADCALLALPAAQARSLAEFGGPDGYSDAIVVAGPGPRSERHVIDAMRSILSVADIDAFRLLFQGMAPRCAGRLYSRLAAIGARELGATTSDAGCVDDVAAIRRLIRLVRCRSAPVGARACGEEGGTAVETVS
jgi:flagellar biosynthesis protein FlhG